MGMRKVLAGSAWTLATVGLLLSFGGSSRALGVSFDVAGIDVPGATLTVASGINAGGDIVGWYADANNRQHGFLRTGENAWTSIDFPTENPSNPVFATDARGIGPGGDIVGTYRLAHEPTTVPAHGYLRTRQGVFSRIDHPDHINTIAQRILPNGTILGCYHDTNTMDTMHGMLTSRKGIVAFDMGMTMHNGATPDGKRIAGFWSDSTSHGYLVEGDSFTSFDVPGSASTAAWDMNARREIVGVYTGADKRVHGFLVDADWQFTTIDVSGATITRAFGINSGGDVVGAYVAGGITHGYVAHRSDN
jgi:probable HAF family extracellular repeat protein